MLNISWSTRVQRHRQSENLASQVYTRTRDMVWPKSGHHRKSNKSQNHHQKKRGSKSIMERRWEERGLLGSFSPRPQRWYVSYMHCASCSISHIQSWCSHLERVLWKYCVGRVKMSKSCAFADGDINERIRIWVDWYNEVQTMGAKLLLQ